MKQDCLNDLIDPKTSKPLELKAFTLADGEVQEGLLSQGESWYPILGGVPKILSPELLGDLKDFALRHGLAVLESGSAEEGKRKTKDTFSDKWTRFKQYGLEASHQEFLYDWYQKKLGLSSLEALKDFYRNKKKILEVGPGSGFNSRFMAEQTEGTVYSVDISDAAMTTYENTRELKNCYVFQADLMQLPFEDNSFDFIIADGVLHHTPDTQKAVEALFRKLQPGGQCFFYVYKKMGAARQFCDEYIRDKFMKLEPEDCYKACEGLTELGRELSKVEGKVKLEKPVDVLGIPAGEHDVQRLFYYYFVKCFWNDAFDYETNNMVNFDWYHPHYAWQHTEGEVAEWLKNLGVTEYSFQNANPNGISVLWRKPLND